MNVTDIPLTHKGEPLTDHRGRKLGARVTIVPAFDRGYASVRVHKTLDGEPFGALPQAAVVAWSDEAVRAEVERRVLGIVKRTLKRNAAHASGEIERLRDKVTGKSMRVELPDDPGDGKYQVVCEEHATVVGVPSLAAARSSSTLDFCDDCREEREVAERAAAL